MKHKKAILLILAMMTMVVNADADDITIDSLRYTLNTTDKTASVVGVAVEPNSPDFEYGSFTIPENIEYGGVKYIVTSIGNRAFWGKSITSVTIPNSVETIGDDAFWGDHSSSHLDNIFMGTGVKSIGMRAFGTSSYGVKVHISDLTAWCNVDHAGGNEAIGCSNPLCYGYLYMNGQKVENLEIPYGVTSIKPCSFMGCRVTTVTIPNSVVSIEGSAFWKAKMKSVTIPESVTSIGNSAFCGCEKLTSLTLPSSLTTIGDHSFSGCAFTSISIPNSVTSIGPFAFSDCGRLTSVITEIEKPFEIGPSTFYLNGFPHEGIYANVPLTVPPGTEALYKATSDWNKFKIIVEKVDDRHINIKAKDYEIKYGDPLPEKYEYTVEGGILKGEPSVTCDVSGMPNVGTYSIVVSKGTVENPDVAYTNGTLTIVAALTKVTKEPKEKTNLIYNGTAQQLVNAGEATGGTIKYSLDGVNYSNDIPTGTDVKTYTVYYKVVGDGNHTDIAPESLTVTISPKNLSNPTIILDQYCHTYDGNPHKPSVTVKDGDTVIPSDQYNVSYENNIDPGTAKVIIIDKDGGNYIVNGSVNFSIVAASTNLTPPSARNLVYNGTAQELVVAGKAEGGTMQYSLDGVTYSTTIPTGTDAKTYTVYYKVVGDGNHTDIDPVSLTVTISPKNVSNPTIILDQYSYTYDGNPHKPSVTVKDGDTVIPSDQYSISYENNIDPGTAKVIITDKDGGNYIVNGSANFSILDDDSGNDKEEYFVESGIKYYKCTYDENYIKKWFANNEVEYTGINNINDTEFYYGFDQPVQIPETVTHEGITYTVIGVGGIMNDWNWENVPALYFPSSIRYIGEKSFCMCSGVHSIYSYAIEPIKLEDDVFRDINKETCVVYVPQGSVEKYKIATIWSEFKSIVEIGSTITTKSFEENGMNYELTKDNAISLIGGQVEGEYEIPSTVTHEGVSYEVISIEAEAFMNNIEMTQLSIPASVQSIGDNAFAGCSSLSAIYSYRTSPAVLGISGSRTRAIGASSVFEGVDMDKAVLYVPQGCVEKYRAAEGWGEFTHIMEMGSTGISSLYTESKSNDVYDLQGRRVRTGAPTLDGLPRGIYIINGTKALVK